MYERLGYELGVSNVVLSIMEKVNPDQSGTYFDLHTALIGLEHRVDVKTLVFFWRKFGVAEEDRRLALAGKEVSAETV